MENEGQREKGEANNFMVRGRPNKYWRKLIRHVMERLQLTEDMIHDRKVWRTRIKLSHCVLEEFEDAMSDSKQEVENLLQQILDDVDNNVRCKYNMDQRYLIVLDDMWDIDTWDELTRPFPKVVNGSRIIFKTRQKEVAFHGKCNTDPLNLRLLSSEESWELLEKRAFGKESCPDEILDVGKEIALNCNHPTCQIHGLVHDFCLIKARQEKLLGKISSSDPSSSSDLMPRIVTIFYDKEHCGPNNFVLLNSKKKRHSDDMEDRLSDACRVRDFKLLRMLDLSPSFMLVKDSLLNEIGMWNHLSGPSLATNWPWDFHFPSNLKTLVLRDFLLTSYSLSTIARLPNLEVLFLVRTIFQGEEWNMGEEDTFENHKYLELEEVTLAKWEVGEEFFPVLEKLALWRCHKLTKIPPNFGDIGSLKLI
ncbi:hypothetical protein T459_16033 [Capsicum annuum]|uniref:NB-ARC domain-containing protein n=1 Tax=Capsicum annuum TaxID=4072 RepID=A0A2G2Z7V0_CAPAN|nr:hypothetical protein T459_16033 [Capsicum annuum]